MKIAIIACVYKRPELTKIIFDYYKSMQQEFQYELIAVGSEGEASRNICEGAGWNYVEHGNMPLSHKVNRLFDEVKKYNVKGALWINSDTLISPPLLKAFCEEFSGEADSVIGLKDLYFYSITKEKTIRFSYKDCKEIMGTARFYSKKVLQKISYKPCGDERKYRGVDSHSSRYLAKLGVQEHAFNMDDTGGVCVDIKSDIVMTPFEMLYDHNCIETANGEIFSHAEEVFQKITALKETMSETPYVIWQEEVKKR